MSQTHTDIYTLFVNKMCADHFKYWITLEAETNRVNSDKMRAVYVDLSNKSKDSLDKIAHAITRTSFKEALYQGVYFEENIYFDLLESAHDYSRKDSKIQSSIIFNAMEDVPTNELDSVKNAIYLMSGITWESALETVDITLNSLNVSKEEAVTAQPG